MMSKNEHFSDGHRSSSNTPSVFTTQNTVWGGSGFLPIQHLKTLLPPITIPATIAVTLTLTTTTTIPMPMPITVTIATVWL